MCKLSGILFGFSVFFTAFMAAGGLHAQSSQESQEEDAPLIIEEETETLQDLQPAPAKLDILEEYFDKHIGLRLGTSYAHDVQNTSYRSFFFINLTWEDDFDWISFHFDVEFYRRDEQYTLEVFPEYKEMTEETRDMLRAEGETTESSAYLSYIEGLLEEFDREPEKKLSIIENEFLYRDAYAKLDFEYAELSVGWHTIVWGQFAFLSPVDLLLPVRDDGGELALAKVYSRLPQPAAILSVFPVREVEFQAYYFPELPFTSVDRSFFERERIAEDREVVHPFEYPEGTAKSRYAGRLLLYLDDITLGFTYYDGWAQGGEDPNREIRRKKEADTEGNLVNVYEMEETPRLQRLQGYGVETSVPVGKSFLKFEILYSEGKLPLDILNFSTLNSYIINGTSPDSRFEARQNLARWAVEENRGRLEADLSVQVFAVGVDREDERWLFNLGILGVYGRPITKRDREGYGLWLEHLEAEGIDTFDESSEGFFGLLPYVHVGRYLESDKSSIIGGAAGVYSTSFGLIGYISKEYFESLRLAMSIEFLSLNTLIQIIEVEPGYFPKNPFGPSIRGLISYKF